MKNAKLLEEIEDIGEYLDKLLEVKCKYIIALVVRDTAGNNMPADILKKIHDIGFESFSNELWRMYIGMQQEGDVVIDYIADECEEPISRKIWLEKEDVRMELTSESWRRGNRCSVKINGIESAINKRGINIVVYDYEKQDVVDSVRFDSHDKNFVFERKAELETLSKKIKWLGEKHHYDVCLTGVWYGANYGSILNGYSAYKVLESMGKKVLMLHKTKSPVNDAELRADNHNVKFYSTYYPDDRISPVFTYDELELLNDYCDCFCSGSDQIWNYNVSFDGNMYLPFVHKDKWKISFASSFGSINDHVPDEHKKEVGECFKCFDAISVREEFDKQILRDKYEVDSTVVLDPVFCIDKQEYDELIKKSCFSENSFILAYILDPSDEKLEFLKQVGEYLNKQVITISDGAFGVINSSWIKYEKADKFPNLRKKTEVVDFLKSFAVADFVVTDSFHGTAFSLIFQKKFVSICNSVRGKDRFYDLLGRFGLLERLIDSKHIVWNEKYNNLIDYSGINKLIDEEKNRTLKWLQEALIISKKKLKVNMIQAEREKLQTNSEFIKIRILASLFHDYGIKHIVLSPGGRDVPLVRMFEYNEEKFVLHRVTDERSAGYYGLGIATQLRQPVACICTSGTAASNYLPAVTEAYYTGVPLIVVTADRQDIYHNHGEDQTIPQRHIYDGVVKKSITVPEGSGYKVEYQTRRDISDCILEATHNGFGPVHINIAIDNIAIGEKAAEECWKILPRIMPHILRVGFNDGERRLQDWVNELKKSQRILVVYGQNPPLNEQQTNWIESFVRKYNCVIVTDHISNLECSYSLKPYNVLQNISNAEFNEKLSPDILITVGGKRLMNDPLTFKVRGGLKNIRHWSVTPDGKIKDFYFRLTSVIEMTQDNFFKWFSCQAGDSINNGVYYEQWRQLTLKCGSPKITRFNSNYIQSTFFPSIPANSMLHLGVGQSFYDCRKYCIHKAVEVYCNMGTNGIDGCTSTFLGQCAVMKDKLCFLIIGDLSFFYDMNSIWNKPLNKNIRILMVNNNGSGLLRRNNLKGITASHNTSARGWVESTGFRYISANSMEEYDELLKYFISSETELPLFFEVFCE